MLAGAGTGKTRVLTTRLAHILATGRARPGQVLAVTFTNKAAREMIGRVEHLIGRSAAGLWLGTFHAMAARILRRHAELAGLKPDFTILDTDDQVRLLKQLIQAADIDEKRWPARTLSIIIQRWKDRGLTVDKVAGADGADYANGRAPDLYKAYQERLRTVNAADFGDLLLHNLTLFTRHADVLADYQQRFRYLLVDEYQDTNVAQYLWLRLLAQTHHSICCVGDDDQSIYGWRGAEVGNILRFEQDFPGAQVVRLERNYRSTGHILAAASGLIAHNAGRLGKTLWTEGEDGEKVRISETRDGDEEARAVGDAIEGLQRAGESLDSMAILVRAGFQTRAFEETLSHHRPALPRDRGPALLRTPGDPRRRGLHPRRGAPRRRPRLRAHREPAQAQPRRGLAAPGPPACAGGRHLALPRGGAADRDRRAQAPRAFGARRADRPASRLARGPRRDPPCRGRGKMLDESGYTGMWQKDRSPAAPGRLENLKELVDALSEFEDLAAFLDHVSLVMDREGEGAEEMVNIMTLHGAKGLEFETVFLPRVGAYVGLTRARRRAHVLFAANRHRQGLFPHQLALDEAGSKTRRAGGGAPPAEGERLRRAHPRPPTRRAEHPSSSPLRRRQPAPARPVGERHPVAASSAYELAADHVMLADGVVRPCSPRSRRALPRPWRGPGMSTAARGASCPSTRPIAHAAGCRPSSSDALGLSPV